MIGLLVVMAAIHWSSSPSDVRDALRKARPIHPNEIPGDYVNENDPTSSILIRGGGIRGGGIAYIEMGNEGAGIQFESHYKTQGQLVELEVRGEAEAKAVQKLGVLSFSDGVFTSSGLGRFYRRTGGPGPRPQPAPRPPSPTPSPPPRRASAAPADAPAKPAEAPPTRSVE